MLWFLIGSSLVFLVAVYLWLWKKITSEIPASYPSQANRQKIDTSKKILVCLGDSNTHGLVSYNWVSDLERMYPDWQVFNAGINSDLTYTLLQRLEDVIACKPDFVTILIGTNDINATMSEQLEKSYKQMGRITKDTFPDFDGFRRNYTEIIQRIKNETHAKIALISLPVMGEDLTHTANQKADEYSEFIRELAYHENLSYLPLREKQKDFLQAHPQPLKHRFEETMKLFISSLIYHFVLGKNWDYTSQKHGYQLTPDNLHMNSTAGQMIRDLVKNFIDAETNRQSTNIEK
ncbi:SGNH/GDSL hydrolase family protein [Emticicia sp. 17c]|uniref:SGNH/GDSL hydrolase family protein n=1 Tax=Emticicia sp. 17c TaxID=3127704 RepID=UPI00301CB6EB